MRKTTVARRYAKALIELAAEEGAQARFATELRDLLAAFKDNPELSKVLSNPIFKVEERRALAAAVAEKTGASDTIKKFLELLFEGGKTALLEEICIAYFSMEDEHAGRVRATLVCTPGSASGLIDSVKEKLKTETGKEVILSEEADPELIGGFVIKIGNTMLDCSLKTQLVRMKEKILEGVV